MGLQNRVAAGTVSGTDEYSVTRHIAIAGILVALLVLVLGVWASRASLTGAVVAPGTFIVERNVKKVQHSTGGIIAEIKVKEGDRVKAGDTVLLLDPTQAKAELGIVLSQSVELTARKARLMAERDLERQIAFPDGFPTSTPEAAQAAASEERLFAENQRAREGQKAQLRVRIDQIKDEIAGLTAQSMAKIGELGVATVELKGLRDLGNRQLVTTQRVNALDRDVRRLEGDRGSIMAQIARARGQVAEVDLQILMIDDNLRANAQRDLRATEAKLVELAERELAAKDKLARISISAPISGLVHELTVHTVGGVITPAEQLMLIVPEEESLTIQARVQPNDIDQIKIGRPARLRLSAFNQQQTSEIDGLIVHVSGDSTTDTKTGQSYYLIRAEMIDKNLKSIQNIRLLPGMPVEVFLSTSERTMLSYLIKPFFDQMERAFRE
jgi:HlyD family secretion protein